MFDIDELMKRAQAASDAASQQLQESMPYGSGLRQGF